MGWWLSVSSSMLACSLRVLSYMTITHMHTQMILIPHGIHLFITFTFFISLVIYLVNVFVTNLLVQICDSLS